jgi:hypothetical protein
VLQVNTVKVNDNKDEKPPRWKYKKNKFPNGVASYWIKWKLYPDDARFFSQPKTMIIRFDKELDHMNNENISAFNNNSSCFNVFSENLMISGKFDKKDMEKTDEIINEINNLTKLNNINFNNSINFNVENVLNDLLQKNNDCLFASNEKEKIHLEIKKN